MKFLPNWLPKFKQAPAIGLPAAPLQVDLHSHLVPGVDDGAASLAQAEELMQGLAGLGYRKLITTPHINAEHANTAQRLKNAFETIEPLGKSLGIELVLSAEYFLDELFLEAVANKQLLSFSPPQYVLFETSHSQRPMALEEAIYLLIKQGYRPILAHPERYAYLWNRPMDYQLLHKTGVLFQVNINSFSGYYSPQVKKAAEQLAQWGLIDLLGSDTHHSRHIELLGNTLRSKAVQQLLLAKPYLNVTL